jgi:hypothetical protein
MISALVQIGKNWRDVNYPLRQKAIRDAAPEFCLSANSFELGLDWIFSCWNEEVLNKISRSHANSFATNAVQVVAGNTPAVMAQAFLQGAMLHVPQLIKIPRLQQIFPKLLHASFRDVSPELADLFFVDSWENRLPDFYAKLATVDLVIAYGDDSTLATIKQHCAPTCTFIGHGHAVSCAVIFKEGANKRSLTKLAWDMLSYDQRGCLSPKATFVEQGGELSSAQCAALFANEVLPTLASRFPRGGLFPGEAVAIKQRRAVYGFRGSVYSGADWTVCYDDRAVWPEESLPRFMPFKPFDDMEQLGLILQPVNDAIISIGVAGGDDAIFNYPNLRHVCAIGDMQKQLLL